MSLPSEPLPTPACCSCQSAQGVFEVKTPFLESGVQLSNAAARAVAEGITRYAAWHGMPEVGVWRTEPERVSERLRLTWLDSRAGSLRTATVGQQRPFKPARQLSIFLMMTGTAGIPSCCNIRSEPGIETWRHRDQRH